MDYYNEIKNEIIDIETYKRVKDYSKNKKELDGYYKIGKLIVEAQGGESRAKYGDELIKDFSKKLVLECGKKYNERTLRRIRQFYLFFKNEKWSTMSTKICWSHFTELLSIKDNNKIKYYIRITEKQNLGVRELREKIKNKEYERLDDKTKDKLITKEKTEIQDYIKHPIIIKNTNYEDITEKVLEQLILEDIDFFLKELGEGFTYVGHQYKIKVEETYNYIDILLFNIKYNCYTVVELKTTKLKKEHIGQIQTYMDFIDKEVKTIYQNKTIGIIVCKENNEYVIKYCSNPNIYQTTYSTIKEDEIEYT